MKNGMNTDDIIYYVCKNTFFQTKQEATITAGNCSFPCLPCMERQRLFKFLKNKSNLFIDNWKVALEKTHMFSSAHLGDGNDEEALKITKFTSEFDNHFFPDRFFLSAKFKNKNSPDVLEIKSALYVSSRSEKEDGSDADNDLAISNSILIKTPDLFNASAVKKLHKNLFEENDLHFLFKKQKQDHFYTGEQSDIFVEMFIAKGDEEIIEKISNKKTTLLVPNETRKMYLEKWTGLLKLAEIVLSKNRILNSENIIP